MRVEKPQSMFNFFRNLFVFTLLFGLILAEVFVNTDQFKPSPASSGRQLTGEEQTMILSILKGGDETPLPPTVEPLGNFLDFDIPNPSEIIKEARTASTLVYRPFNQPTLTPPSPIPTNDYSPTNSQDLLNTLLPPTTSPLYTAYQDGGQAWYYEGNNVLVIFRNGTISSFDKPTGIETIWLQKELAYPPIMDIDAILNYQLNYNAKVVAQTSTWALMKFPSGGFVKVAKPSYQPLGELPEILPGYENL